jgi:hypothetical protein
MFELHVVVASVVMFNILELIMEIVPNYPTDITTNVSPWMITWPSIEKIFYIYKIDVLNLFFLRL